MSMESSFHGSLSYEDMSLKQLRQYWRTPKQLFDALNEEFDFTLDGAANEHNALCAKFNTEGHQHSWKGHRVFVNPPFRFAKAFARKAVEDGADLTVAVLPSSLNSKWFHQYVLPFAAEIRIPLSRLQFEPPPGLKSSTNSRDTLIAVWCGSPSVPQFVACDPKTGRVLREPL